ncbi:MAG: hypothetical protein KatS3mg065_0950 [Chloroflexota bacterium]|nr:MAG: hypothetical protein KatS3mg065_0950 [Chloroflexota bacterium]
MEPLTRTPAVIAERRSAPLDGLEIRPGRHRPNPAAVETVLTPEALAFVAELEREFRHARRRLLAARAERQAAIDAGERPSEPPPGPAHAPGWRVPDAPPDLRDRRVEITGPAEAKMMINALNSGASVFMADLEDALSPTWANVVEGQANIAAAVRRRLAYDAPDGRRYRLAERIGDARRPTAGLAPRRAAGPARRGSR